MKIFILGSKSGLNVGKAEILDRFCHKLGAQLGASNHEIILCSEHRMSVDYEVLKGVAASPNIAAAKKLVVHRPDDEVIKKGWRELELEFGLTEPVYISHVGPTFRDGAGAIASEEARRMSFLLCQMAALKECDIVVTVGGRLEGPAAVVLAVAREQRKPILPFRFAGGAADKVYNQIEGDLRIRLDNKVEMLSYEEDGAESILCLIECLLKQPQTVARPRIFLSYSWRRGEYADLVEAILRRQEDVFVFRDENEISSGDSITAKISLELNEKCNMFLALWGREYVESPHCYDEMHLWHEKHGLEQLYLLRFDDTRPVWPLLRRSSDEFARKWPNVDLSKRRPLIEKELVTFINGIRRC